MIDIYSMEVLVPSLVMIGAMSAAMIWGFFKVRGLMNEDKKKQQLDFAVEVVVTFLLLASDIILRKPKKITYVVFFGFCRLLIPFLLIKPQAKSYLQRAYIVYTYIHKLAYALGLICRQTCRK